MGKTVILNNGHGGLINGHYQTPGKRSPEWDKGILYEGVFNRWVVNRLIEKLDRNKIPYYHITPELTDTTLYHRALRANQIFEENPNTYLFNVHANAGGGEGIEGFTSKGETPSDPIASIFLGNIRHVMPNVKIRTDYADGDIDKEAEFYMLTGTACPSFLVECGFMDFYSDYLKLWDETYLDTLVYAFYKSIEQIYYD